MCKGRSRQSRVQTLVNTKWEEPCSAGDATGRDLRRPRDGRRTSTWKSCPSDEQWIEAPRPAAYAAVTLRPAQAPGSAMAVTHTPALEAAAEHTRGDASPLPFCCAYIVLYNTVSFSEKLILLMSHPSGTVLNQSSSGVILDRVSFSMAALYTSTFLPSFQSIKNTIFPYRRTRAVLFVCKRPLLCSYCRALRSVLTLLNSGSIFSLHPSLLLGC